MTAFVLVSGPFTGGWVWEETAARLREAGAAAYPVNLTGMTAGDGRAEEGATATAGGRRPDGEAPEDGVAAGRTPAAPEVDLETHVEDVVRAIDRAGADGHGPVVLVGHDYGIHPVLGAADRRPERCARVVYLDAGMPADGDPASAFVPDPSALARADGGTTPVPAPTGAGWARWGSTEGLTEENLARLDRLAVPQPVRTLTQPLRLTADPSERPMTGVLCTANGGSISMVEMLVASGPPRFRALAGPDVGFFELPTGHWPMLSTPGPLAGVLLRAAAGEGVRLRLPDSASATDGGGSFLLDVPERPRRRRSRVDLHLPDAEGPRPAVVFVHGGPVDPDQRPTPRDTPFLLGHGRHAAGLGLVGATLDHRLHGLADYVRAADDLAEAVDLVRADPRVDPDRIALWFFSAGGLLAADWLAAPPPWLRCVALSYPVLAPLPDWRAVEERFRPTDRVTAASPPVVLTRAEREHPGFQATVDRFLAVAEGAGAEVERIDVPAARHGFELLDHTAETRSAVRRAARSVRARLTG
ncbi:alpha/beta hydrolase [Streptomyces roseicoloratus]|uniref:Alpha/beta hydrolase n=1 Tax=Streptomyces roseicoloratus TaxID=2508722 RepID=A0ABY9RQ28_9ACTN|nr:alpha/beta hydrolase [Streptomyces roseicoloratus]WMX43798.1 alpha/beta hydrolase [Streptomyces roseicoloratus]